MTQHVEIVLPDLRGGGAERVMISLAQEFQRLGVKTGFTLMRAEGALLEAARDLGPVRDLECMRVRDLTAPLAQHLTDLRPDGVLAGMWPVTCMTVRAALIAGRGTKIAVSDHSLLSRQYVGRGLVHRALLRGSIARDYRRADLVVGVSRGVAEDLTRLGWLPNDCAKVIHNPVQTRSCEDLNALERAEALWTHPRGRRILSVGRFKAVKNHKLLIESFARLPERETARLMLLGDGPMEQELREYAAHLGVLEYIIFAGFHSDPSPFYATADLLVLSSELEGFGNVLVESMAQGTPVVSTDCPSGPSEILEAGRYGCLVPVGDATAMALAIEKTIEQPVPSAELQRRAAEFSPNVAAQAYLAGLFGEVK